MSRGKHRSKKGGGPTPRAGLAGGALAARLASAFRRVAQPGFPEHARAAAAAARRPERMLLLLRALDVLHRGERAEVEALAAEAAQRQDCADLGILLGALPLPRWALESAKVNSRIKKAGVAGLPGFPAAELVRYAISRLRGTGRMSKEMKESHGFRPVMWRVISTLSASRLPDADWQTQKAIPPRVDGLAMLWEQMAMLDGAGHWLSRDSAGEFGLALDERRWPYLFEEPPTRTLRAALASPSVSGVPEYAFEAAEELAHEPVEVRLAFLGAALARLDAELRRTGAATALSLASVAARIASDLVPPVPALVHLEIQLGMLVAQVSLASGRQVAALPLLLWLWRSDLSQAERASLAEEVVCPTFGAAEDLTGLMDELGAILDDDPEGPDWLRDPEVPPLDSVIGEIRGQARGFLKEHGIDLDSWERRVSEKPRSVDRDVLASMLGRAPAGRVLPLLVAVDRASGRTELAAEEIAKLAAVPGCRAQAAALLVAVLGDLGYAHGPEEPPGRWSAHIFQTPRLGPPRALSAPLGRSLDAAMEGLFAAEEVVRQPDLDALAGVAGRLGAGRAARWKALLGKGRRAEASPAAAPARPALLQLVEALHARDVERARAAWRAWGRDLRGTADAGAATRAILAAIAALQPLRSSPDEGVAGLVKEWERSTTAMLARGGAGPMGEAILGLTLDELASLGPLDKWMTRQALSLPRSPVWEWLRAMLGAVARDRDTCAEVLAEGARMTAEMVESDNPVDWRTSRRVRRDLAELRAIEKADRRRNKPRKGGRR